MKLFLIKTLFYIIILVPIAPRFFRKAGRDEMYAQTELQEILLSLGKIVTNKTGQKPTGKELAKLASDVRVNLTYFFAADSDQLAKDTKHMREDWKMDYDDFYREIYLRGIRANAKALYDQGKWPQLEEKLREFSEVRAEIVQLESKPKDTEEAC